MPARRRWLFRWAAVLLIPLLFLLALEIGLRLVGYGYPTGFFLRARIQEREMLLSNLKFGWRFFPPALVRHPQAVVMPARKPPQTCRIFVFGESAAQGDPDPSFGFSRVLEAMLRERHPSTRFEVVNTAITAISSHVILPAARDCARYQGDVWIVYMGNNEVVGPFGAGTVFNAQVPGLGFIRATLALKTTRFGQWLEAIGRQLARDSSTPKSWGGMEMFLRQQVRQDDPRMAKVYGHFEQNLKDIVALGVGCGAKVIVCTVGSNLRDCPPFASLHRVDLSAAQQTEWERLFQTGVAAEQATHLTTALEAFQAAARIDDRHAELAFRRARCAGDLGRFDEARTWFAQARDLDALRFRADSRINEIIRGVAENRERDGVYLADAAQALAARSPQSTPGEEFFYEHVHLKFEGNYVIATNLLDAIGRCLPAVSLPAPLPSAAEAAQWLTFTEWNRYQSLESMLERMRVAPFTHQLGHAEQLQRMEAALSQLRPHSKPFALKTIANEYRQAIARHPEDDALRQNYAKLLELVGDDAGAIEQWRQVIQRVPHDAVAYYNLANYLDKLGRSAEARLYFQAALKVRPDFHEALNGLGLTLVNLGNFDEAVAAYERALRYRPDFAEGHVNLGLVLAKRGRTAEAIAHYQEALRLKPGGVAAHINLGNLLSSQGQTAAARDHLAEAVKLSPDDAIAHFNLANACSALGDRDQALLHFGEAVRCKTNFTEARINYALALEKNGRGEEALAQLQEAVRLQPNSATAQFNLGVALAQRRRWDEAIRQFRETLRLEPNHVEARRNLDAAEAAKGKSR